MLQVCSPVTFYSCLYFLHPFAPLFLAVSRPVQKFSCVIRFPFMGRVICLIWTYFACPSVRPSSGTHSGKMESASSLLIQWEGGVSRLGCYWAEWDSVAARLERSAAGCCVCQRPVSCSPALETQWQPSDVLQHPLLWLSLTVPVCC